MEFYTFNNVVKLCLQGMEMEVNKLFLQGFDEASNDFEKFLAAHCVARNQKTVSEKIRVV